MDDDEPRLTELELDIVSITRDDSGLVSVDGGSLSVECVVFMLRAAELVILDAHFYPPEDEDDDED